MSRVLAARLALVLIGLVVAWSPARSFQAQNANIPDARRAVNAATQAPSSRFKSGSDVVVVDFCVQARDGRFMPGLSADEFLLLDDNVPQNIAFFSAEERLPLSVVLLIDRSSSMAGPKLEAAKAAAVSFLHTLRPRDVAEVMAFNDHASRLFPLTSDRSADDRSIAGLSADGGTGLFEAELVGVHDLEQAQRARRRRYHNALVILSDGDDTSSLVTFDDVLDEVRGSGVMVYAVSLRTGQRNRWLAPPHELAQLAQDTGGRAVAVGAAAGLASLYQEIGLELQQFYELGFVSAPSVRDGRWHSISVRVPGRDVSVRARSGYYAPRPTPGLTP